MATDRVIAPTRATQRYLLGALFALTVVACTKKIVSLEGRPCDTVADCLGGYACNTVQHVCERVGTSCADGDGDGYGVGAGCLGGDCDDTVIACTTDCTTDADHDGEHDCIDDCLDVDHDGYGVGAGCPGTDCDDTTIACTSDCSSIDIDIDPIPDCRDECFDADGDGLGDGTVGNAGCEDLATDDDDHDNSTCADTDGDGCDDCSSAHFDPGSDGTDVDGDGWCYIDGITGDCDDGVVACTNDCTGDVDLDTTPDCRDPCVDFDGDGIGRDAYARTGCLEPNLSDSNDGNANVCGDADLDGCDDCADTGVDAWAPDQDGTDIDGDGICAVNDCDDHIPTCTFDCATNSDSDPTTLAGSTTLTTLYRVADCFEQYCGTDPTNTSAALDDHCATATSQSDLNLLITDAAARSGREHIVLGSFDVDGSMTTINAVGGIWLRGSAECVLTVTANTAPPLFRLQGNDVVIEDVALARSGGSDYNAVMIDGDDVVLRRVSIDGFRRYGVVVLGSADNTLIAQSTISGGTDSAGDDKGGIVVGDASAPASIPEGTRILDSTIRGNHMVGIQIEVSGLAGTLIAGNRIVGNDVDGVRLYASGDVVSLVGNVVAGNGEDGIEVIDAATTRIDHNTIATNSQKGVRFSGSLITGACMRNNIVSHNGLAAVELANAVGWDVTPACTAPLVGGTNYGNNLYGNTQTCLGSCVDPYPVASNFWQYAIDPAYRSTDVDVGTYYCLGASNGLIDAGADLGYDLILPLAQAPQYLGTAPDIGGRESGAAGCPP